MKNKLFGGSILKTDDLKTTEIEFLISLSQKLKAFRDHNISTRLFEEGFGFGYFSHQDHEKHFAFRIACDMLGLKAEVWPKAGLDESGAFFETFAGIAGNADIVAISDENDSKTDLNQMSAVNELLKTLFENKTISYRPGLINLRSAVDWPVQAMTELLFLKDHFGSIKALKGRKVTISWTFDTQNQVEGTFPVSLIKLFKRFGMEITLSYPAGLELPRESGLSASDDVGAAADQFKTVNSFKKALIDAEIVYLIPWKAAPSPVDDLTGSEDVMPEQIPESETDVIVKPGKWKLTPKKMNRTHDGNALVLNYNTAFAKLINTKPPSNLNDSLKSIDLNLIKRKQWSPFIVASMILSLLFDDPNSLLQAKINNKQMRKSDPEQQA